VAVVHYRRLFEERTHNRHIRIGMLSREKNTCRKMQEISMQPFGGAFNLIAPTSTCGPLLNGLDSELGTSSPFARSTISDLGNIVTHMSKRTPRLSWLESEVELCADKEKKALFIFDEYCDRGAPQGINLSRRERNELVEFFSHSIKDPDKLKTIFDRAFDSVLELLENDTVIRFKRRASFAKMVKVLRRNTISSPKPDCQMLR